MVDIDKIFSIYYTDNPELLATVIIHSECVTKKALECVKRHSLDVDESFVTEAAMLHDIGVIRCQAPSIFCYGTKPYICHGIEGKEMLESLNLPKHALVCERHTGSGLSLDDIVRQDLPLPRRDMLPVSLEEKLICYADKFFSKSGDIEKEKSLERVKESMRRHGTDTLNRFLELHALFG